MTADLQRIHVKMLAEAPLSLSLDPFLAIFGQWRNDKSHPARWVDLADYAHMAKGPVIVLAGHQGNYSLDRNDPGLGLLYAGKKDFEGSDEERIVEAFRRCLDLTKVLIGEAAYPADLKLQPGSWEIFINDRLEFPNDDDTDARLRLAVKSALDRLFGSGAFTAERDSDPQRRYGFSIRASADVTMDTLLERVAG